MIRKGVFLITDITGYTTFMTKSELDHAQHIIEALFESQLEVIQPPLVVSNFQGDAILCYAPDDQIADGGDILELVDDIYGAFRRKMAEMQVDPPCSCKACSTIDGLDLKVFIHHGDYLVRTLGDREEILGSDVILAHRMMKNSVTEKTGMDSYLMISEPAYERLGVANSGLEVVPHQESYDHTGAMKHYLAPLSD